MSEILFKNIFTGTYLGLFAFFAFCLNVSVLFVLIRCKFLTRQSKGIYILAGANLFGDIIQEFLIFAWIAPTSVFQSFIITEDKNHWLITLFGYIFLTIWYEGVIIQGAIAFDRLLNVVFPQLGSRFKKNWYKPVVILVYSLSAFMALWSQFWFPCCRIYMYFGTFGFIYFGKTYNYSDHIIDLPLNTLITLFIFVSYAWLFIYVHRTNRITAQTLNGLRQMQKRSNELKFAMQFAVLGFVLAFAWISFRVFPLFISPTMPQFYSLTTLALAIHCSMNSLVFLIMNTDFRHKYAETFGFRNHGTLHQLEGTLTHEIQSPLAITPILVDSWTQTSNS